MILIKFSIKKIQKYYFCINTSNFNCPYSIMIGKSLCYFLNPNCKLFLLSENREFENLGDLKELNF